MDLPRSGPGVSRARDASLARKTTIPLTPPAPERVRPTEKGPRRAGLLLVATGVLLLVLAAGDAPAGASAPSFGGGADEAMRGSGGDEHLVGMGGG